MSQVSDLNARLLTVQRERDQLREVNCKLRDKLLSLAKECGECDGTGMITLDFPTFDKVMIDDCPVCHDIRSLLA